MDPDLKKDLAFLGADESVLPAWKRGKDLKHFTVYACNRDAFEVFSRVSTQWRSDGFSRIGLDYGVVFEVMDRMPVAREEQLALLDKVQRIEAGYLNEINSKK